MFLTEQQIAHREEINKNMLNLPKQIEQGNLPDFSENVIIRLFYYEIDATEKNEYGIIEPKYKFGQSDGGKVIAAISDYPFQRRGVIVKASKKAIEDGCKVGQIVWLPTHTYESPVYEFLYNKEAVSDSSEGYKNIPYRHIEYVETEMYS